MKTHLRAYPWGKPEVVIMLGSPTACDRQGQLIARLLDMLEAADLHPDIDHALNQTVREYKPEVTAAFLGRVVDSGVPSWSSRIPGTPWSGPQWSRGGGA